VRTRSALAVAVTAVAAVAAAGRIRPALAVAVTAMAALMVSGASAAGRAASGPEVSGEKANIYLTINIRPEDATPSSIM